MKLLSLVVLCSVAAAVKGDMEAYRAIVEACAKDTGASADDIAALQNHQAAKNMETKCLRACVLKKLDIMNDDGKFVKEAALKQCQFYQSGDADKMKVAEEVVGHCAEIPVPDEHCEAAELFKMCWYEQAVKHGMV